MKKLMPHLRGGVSETWREEARRGNKRKKALGYQVRPKGVGLYVQFRIFFREEVKEPQERSRGRESFVRSNNFKPKGGGGRLNGWGLCFGPSFKKIGEENKLIMTQRKAAGKDKFRAASRWKSRSFGSIKARQRGTNTRCLE